MSDAPTKPAAPRTERRQARFSPPPCPKCAAKTAVVTRTDYVLYVRCTACAYVWSVPKPAV